MHSLVLHLDDDDELMYLYLNYHLHIYYINLGKRCQLKLPDLLSGSSLVAGLAVALLIPLATRNLEIAIRLGASEFDRYNPNTILIDPLSSLRLGAGGIS